MINMKKFKLLGLSLLFAGFANAQDIKQAKIAIDAEQYQKAKNTLTQLIAKDPQEGKNYYFMGDIYLTQSEPDSAAYFFNKGKAVKDNPEYNVIGLANIDLNNGDAAAAQAKFAQVEKELRKKDTEQLIYIAKAYIYALNPNYPKAIEYLNKVIEKDENSGEGYYYLGEAQYRNKDSNAAFSAYRNAARVDNTILKAQLKLGVLKKNTKAAFPEAIKDFNDLLAKNPNYGPAYRELAETYYLWGTIDRTKYAENTKQALGFYEKYMTLTDYSLNSRMRHADFLVLAGDYKALEEEAKAMQQLDNVNPRVHRYLAYAAYENGNYQESLDAMELFLSKIDTKYVIARDYLYRGLAKLALNVGTDEAGNNIITDQAKFDGGIADIKKATETDINVTAALSNVAQKLLRQKLYTPAAIVYEIAVSNPESTNVFSDNFYYGITLYAEYVLKTPEAQQADTVSLKKADTALAKVIEINPEYTEVYPYKAKIGKLMNTPEGYDIMAKAYESYAALVVAKGDADIQKNKKTLIEAYENLGNYYAAKDKAKAKEYYTKALELDPESSQAKQEIQKL
jgi:tetratricopeptide (TPR) repeat protein